MHPAHRYMLFLKEAYSTFILFFERVANIQKVSADNISPQETSKSPLHNQPDIFLCQNIYDTMPGIIHASMVSIMGSNFPALATPE